MSTPADTTARCRECRRTLRVPSPDGYGPVCRRRINAQPEGAAPGALFPITTGDLQRATRQASQATQRATVLAHRITAVHRLHSPSSINGPCPVDGEPYPCTTVRALDGQTDTEQALANGDTHL